MATSGTTTADSATGGATYDAPNQTIAEIEAAVARALGWSVSDATELAKIDEAITAAAQTATTWRGRVWSWRRANAQFTTAATATISTAVRATNVVTITTAAAHGLIAGCMARVRSVTASAFNGIYTVVSATTLTFTYAQNRTDASSTGGYADALAYPLRTVNSAIMTDAAAVEHMYYFDNWELGKSAMPEWRLACEIITPSPGQPYTYVTFNDPPMIGVMPSSDAAYNLDVTYIRRHSKITSAGSTDAALILPGEYHWPVYVNAASWLLKHETLDPASLEQCPAFVEAMNRMAANEPTGAEDLYPDAQGGLWPHDRRVFVTDGGTLIMNTPSL